jgi:hypothetical protein
MVVALLSTMIALIIENIENPDAYQRLFVARL